MENKGWLWFPAAAAAGILQTAGGMPWPDTALTALLAVCLLRLPRGETLPKWVEPLRSLWNGVILAQVLKWTGDIWLQAPVWTAAGVLTLALWLCLEGKEAMTAAGSVLGLVQLILAGAVLLAALPEIRPENWTWQHPEGSGWLLAMLLVPALGSGPCLPGSGLWALAISFVTTGVLGGKGGYGELSKSVSLFGSIKRLESLAAAGMTLGFVLLSAELLKSTGQRGSLLTAAAAAAGAMMTWRLPPMIAGIGCVVLWVLLPWGYWMLNRGCKQE